MNNYTKIRNRTTGKRKVATITKIKKNEINEILLITDNSNPISVERKFNFAFNGVRESLQFYIKN